jgi:acetyl-CoA carboxylase carboxyltransferase component
VVNKLLNVLLDPGTFRSWDDGPAREPVITGTGTVAGHCAAIVASDFAVLPIDTPGAELSVAAEEAGIAGKIAACIAAMISLPVPTIAVLLGQGTGGGDGRHRRPGGC